MNLARRQLGKIAGVARRMAVGDLPEWLRKWGNVVAVTIAAAMIFVLVGAVALVAGVLPLVLSLSISDPQASAVGAVVWLGVGGGVTALYVHHAMQGRLGWLTVSLVGSGTVCAVVIGVAAALIALGVDPDATYSFNRRLGEWGTHWAAPLVMGVPALGLMVAATLRAKVDPKELTTLKGAYLVIGMTMAGYAYVNIEEDANLVALGVFILAQVTTLGLWLFSIEKGGKDNGRTDADEKSSEGGANSLETDESKGR